MIKPNEEITCSLCGYKFNFLESKDRTCRRGCSFDCSKCNMLVCPNCGHKIPMESKVLSWVGKFVDKIKGRKTKNSKKPFSNNG